MTFPTAVFPYTANVHGNTLLEKEYLDCDVCRIHLQVMLIQNERDQSSKTHFTSCLCIVAEIPSHIYIFSKCTQIHVLQNVMRSLFCACTSNNFCSTMISFGMDGCLFVEQVK